MVLYEWKDATFCGAPKTFHSKGERLSANFDLWYNLATYSKYHFNQLCVRSISLVIKNGHEIWPFYSIKYTRHHALYKYVPMLSSQAYTKFQQVKLGYVKFKNQQAKLLFTFCRDLLCWWQKRKTHTMEVDGLPKICLSLCSATNTTNIDPAHELSLFLGVQVLIQTLVMVAFFAWLHFNWRGRTTSWEFYSKN